MAIVKNRRLPPKIPKRTLNQMMIEFLMFWKNYVFQSAAATLATMIILFILKMENVVVVASIAASIFIVFAMPKAISARKRAIIGGHLFGLLFGSLWTLVPQPNEFTTIVIYSFAVGSTMLAMVIFDMEHPPACGTALGVAITGYSWGVGIAVISSTIILAVIRSLLRPYLKDLV